MIDNNLYLIFIPERKPKYLQIWFNTHTNNEIEKNYIDVVKKIFQIYKAAKERHINCNEYTLTITYLRIFQSS